MTTYFVGSEAGCIISPDHPSAIDMLTPDQVCERLALSRGALLDLVNAGELAAYNLGDGIRFRACRVQAIANSLIAR